MTQPMDIANTIWKTTSYNSSSAHYSARIQRIKNKQKRLPLRFQSENTVPTINPCLIGELSTLRSKSHDAAPGPDHINYQILKQFPEASLQCLLMVFNNKWESGEFRTSWRESTIIPIAKPGKDLKDTNNQYHLIALTSCVFKTEKSMINDRLVWFLELASLITEA